MDDYNSLAAQSKGKAGLCSSRVPQSEMQHGGVDEHENLAQKNTFSGEWTNKKERPLIMVRSAPSYGEHPDHYLCAPTPTSIVGPPSCLS